MENKMKIALAVIAAIILISVMYAFVNWSGSAGQQKGFLAFGSVNISVYSFNHTRVSNISLSGTFLFQNTTANPIAVTLAGRTLIPTSDLQARIASTISGAFNNTLIEKVLVVGYPSISSSGPVGNVSVILYAGNTVGSGDDTIYVFAPNSTSTWQIYTNGASYYVLSGNYDRYVFLYANSSIIANVVPFGSNVNKVVTPQNSSLFPQRFLPYLNSLKSTSGIGFVKDGIWWHSNFYLYRYSQRSPPNGYRLWR